MEVIEQVTAVAGVLALLLGCLWWLRRQGMVKGLARGRTKCRLELMERLPLGPQHSLHLVRLDEALLLVASSPSGCALMDRRIVDKPGESPEAAR